MKKTNTSTLQTLLTVLSVACYLISNVISAKQLQLPFGFTMTAAVFVFPVTYILSDVFSEVYGYKWSRITCYLAFAMNLLMVGFFQLAIITKAPDYWTNQAAYETVLGSAPRTLIASVTAFVVGDFINDKVFEKMKSHDGEKRFGLRAIISSFCGEICDSLVFIPIAFLGTMPIKTLLSMMALQASIKTVYEFIILPVTTLVVKKVKAYEKG